MRILVTGSRHWNDRTTIADALAQAWEDLGNPEGVTLVHGACPHGGADQIAAQEASKRGWTIEAHPADWAAHGKAAGPLRNQQMVDAGADITLAFPQEGSRGTWDCIRRARKAEIPVWVVPAPEGE